jgi:hypothetical protein
MDQMLRKAIITQITSSRRKRVDIEIILTCVRRQVLNSCSDFEIRDRVLKILQHLAGENLIRLPATNRCWNRQTGLPHFVTAVRAEADAKKWNRKKALENLRCETAWEPVRMVAFAHTLKDLDELKRAKQVNQYLLTRKTDAPLIPHRERALEIFGDEKALDRSVRQGLFGGRIALADLDCFYCPEPLPFHPFSLNQNETAGKPLLVVENSNTYWSCCKANEVLRCYAAVVYGQGFQACAAERASDGLLQIETRVAAEGITYFGDLDPAGICIPVRINGYRIEKGLAPLCAERRLYRALLKKDLSVPYAKSQHKNHDPDLAKEWLGNDLADMYLEKAHQYRWPQEGLTTKDILSAIQQHQNNNAITG